MATATRKQTHKVYVIKSPSVIPWDGQDLQFNEHTLIHEDHPVRLKYPELFQLARLSYTDIESATAAPGERRGE